MKLPRRHRHPAGKTSPQHPLFDETWYLNSYPEVANYNGKPWEHFTRHGDSEGRRPGPGFDPEFYRRTYIKLEEQPTTAALEHFTLYGEFHGHVPRPTTLTPMQSTSGIQLALSGRRNPIILVGHDAQRAGAPILLLRIAEGLRDRGLSPVFLLHRGGPLLDDYRALGPTLILDEGWDTAALAGAIPPTVAVVGSTCWSAPVLVALRHRGPILLLLHEMPQYIAEHDLLTRSPNCHT